MLRGIALSPLRGDSKITRARKASRGRPAELTFGGWSIGPTSAGAGDCMTVPPADWPVSGTVSRGSREKQPRAFGDERRVPIISEIDEVIDVRTQGTLDRYLVAPNAEVKRRRDGSVKYIRLRSFGDDRGHPGEKHGRSTITTERVRNDWGDLVGSELNRQHKKSCLNWPQPAAGTGCFAFPACTTASTMTTPSTNPGEPRTATPARHDQGRHDPQDRPRQGGTRPGFQALGGHREPGDHRPAQGQQMRRPSGSRANSQASRDH
jgi:hypothetical protein